MSFLQNMPSYKADSFSLMQNSPAGTKQASAEVEYCALNDTAPPPHQVFGLGDGHRSYASSDTSDCSRANSTDKRGSKRPATQMGNFAPTLAREEIMHNKEADYWRDKRNEFAVFRSRHDVLRRNEDFSVHGENVVQSMDIVLDDTRQEREPGQQLGTGKDRMWIEGIEECSTAERPGQAKASRR